MRQCKQFMISAENDGQSFAKLISSLRKAKVNIQAIAVVNSNDVQTTRMIAMPIGPTKAALRRAGFKFSMKKVLTLSTGGDCAKLSLVVGVLAGNGLPVESSYTGNGDLIVLEVSEVERAARLVRSVTASSTAAAPSRLG